MHACIYLYDLHMEVAIKFIDNGTSSSSVNICERFEDAMD